MAKWQPRKGKKTGQHFVRLDHYVLDSGATSLSLPLPAWHWLRSAGATMVSIMEGSPCRPSTLPNVSGCPKATGSRALLELEIAGFIDTVKVGTFRLKNRMASEYCLTFHRCDVTQWPASKRFLKKPTAIATRNKPATVSNTRISVSQVKP